MNLSKELQEVAIYRMEHSGYKAQLMKATKLKDDGNTHGLPSGTAINVIPIHCLPACPDAWVRGAGTYVCPVSTDWGLWFDWTMNDNNTAIVPSVKGMNPITGYKIEGMNLEQYRDKCPKHNVELGHEGFCPKCEYKLPPQNYVSYPSVMWWDGFRQADGSVRQFFFSEDDKRDIASLVIGKKNTVPAFGFAYFKTKKERFIEETQTRGVSWVDKKIGCFGNFGSNDFYEYTNNSTILDSSVQVINTSGIEAQGALYSCDANDNDKPIAVASAGVPTMKSFKSVQPTKAFTKKLSSKKEVSVGAGAKISQKLETDKLSLDEYVEKPQAVIRLYFVFEEQLNDIVKKGGVKSIEGKSEGFMEGLPVG